MDTSLLIVLAILCGIAIPLQGQFMGLLEQTLGLPASLIITYGGGGFLALLITWGRGGWQGLKHWPDVPWYVFSSGALGLVIVGTISYVVPRLGLTAGFTVIVATQFILGALVDHFGWFGAQIRSIGAAQIAGICLLLLGVRLVGHLSSR
jgi:transporter family-2 protein